MRNLFPILSMVIALALLGWSIYTAKQNYEERRSLVREACLKNGHTVVETPSLPTCIPAATK